MTQYINIFTNKVKKLEKEKIQVLKWIIQFLFIWIWKFLHLSNPIQFRFKLHTKIINNCFRCRKQKYKQIEITWKRNFKK